MNTILRDSLFFIPMLPETVVAVNEGERNSRASLVPALVHSRCFFNSIAPIICALNEYILPSMMELILRADSIIWTRSVSLLDFTSDRDMHLFEVGFLPRMVSLGHLTMMYCRAVSRDFVSRVLYPIASLESISMMSCFELYKPDALVQQRVELLSHPRESVRVGACRLKRFILDLRRAIVINPGERVKTILLEQIAPLLLSILQSPVHNLNGWSKAVSGLTHIAEHIRLPSVEIAEAWLDIVHRLYGDCKQYEHIRWNSTWLFYRMVNPSMQTAEVAWATANHEVFHESLEVFLEYLENPQHAFTTGGMLAVNEIENMSHALNALLSFDSKLSAQQQLSFFKQPLLVEKQLFLRVRKTLEFLHHGWRLVVRESEKIRRTTGRPLEGDACGARRELWTLAYALAYLHRNDDDDVDGRDGVATLLKDLAQTVAPTVNRGISKLRFTFLTTDLRLRMSSKLSKLLVISVFDCVQFPFAAAAAKQDCNTAGAAASASTANSNDVVNNNLDYGFHELVQLPVSTTQDPDGAPAFDFTYAVKFPVVQLLFRISAKPSGTFADLPAVPLAEAHFCLSPRFPKMASETSLEYVLGDPSLRDKLLVQTWLTLNPLHFDINGPGAVMMTVGEVRQEQEAVTCC